jgi:multidrug efflux pump subunit AcrB
MRLVLAALGRPLTVIVALIAILAGFFMAIGRMRMDIFPEVGNPVIYVAQPYGGMTPAQMEGFLTYYYEYHFLYITGIQSVDSKSVQGAALMKLTFREGTNMQQAMAETVGYVNRARAFMPPGTVPPFITRFDPGSIAVGLLLFTSNTHTQGELQNIALNQVRPLFATLPGVSAPPPFGGNQRTIVVTLDPDKLKQYGVSPEQAIAAVTSGTVVSPSGNLYDGTLNRIVRTNSTLGPELNDLMAAPIHPRSGANIYLRDIGTIENGTDIVTAYAHVDGRRTVYIPVTKRSDASTLAVIKAVKDAIPGFKKVMPDDVDVQLAFDQSGYVSNAINGLVREAALGAILTGLVVLLFLRDWRGAIIVVANIPFALFTAVLLLWATDQTINIMTLGGLALAVGVLVDEATVEVENIHTQLLPGVSRARAVLEACRRTVLARLLSMLCVLAVFVPSFFMKGVGRQLFVPLSLAVGFAMVASYFLSSSLVPVFATWIMKESRKGEETEGSFGKLRTRYERYLTYVLDRRWPVIAGYFAVCAIILILVAPRIGSEIFPDSNGPVLRMRLKAPVGTRIEETEPLILQALDLIRKTVGKDNVEITSDYVGVQPSSYPVNLIHLFTSGPEEALVQIQLRPGHPDDERLKEDLRSAFRKEMPQLAVAFEAGDIISQVMSFGSPTPIQIDVQGVDIEQNYTYLAKVEAELHKLAFLRDVSVGHSEPRLCRSVRSNDGRRYNLADSSHRLFPIHSAQLLARSKDRQRLSDSGTTALEPHAGPWCALHVATDARRTNPTAARSGCQTRVWNNARDDRAAERAAHRERDCKPARYSPRRSPDAHRRSPEESFSAPQGLDRRRTRTDTRTRRDQLRPAYWPLSGHRCDLPAPYGEFPIPSSSSRHTLNRSRCPLRCGSHAALHGNHAQHSILYGSDHGDWNFGS